MNTAFPPKSGRPISCDEAARRCDDLRARSPPTQRSPHRAEHPPAKASGADAARAISASVRSRSLQCQSRLEQGVMERQSSWRAVVLGLLSRGLTRSWSPRLDRLARSAQGRYRIISQLNEMVVGLRLNEIT